MAFNNGTQFRIGELGQAGARQDNDVQTRQFVLVLPETLPHPPLYAVAGHSTAQMLLGNAQAQTGEGQSTGPPQHKELAVAGAGGVREDPLELRGFQQPLAPAKRTRGGSRRTPLALSGTAQGSPLRRSGEPGLWHDAR